MPHRTHTHHTGSEQLLDTYLECLYAKALGLTLSTIPLKIFWLLYYFQRYHKLHLGKRGGGGCTYSLKVSYQKPGGDGSMHLNPSPHRVREVEA